jgi:hypothetical protein
VKPEKLICDLYVDPHGQLWMANWPNVLGTIGNGPGKGQVQFTDSNYMAMDSQAICIRARTAKFFKILVQAGSSVAIRILANH